MLMVTPVSATYWGAHMTERIDKNYYLWRKQSHEELALSASDPRVAEIHRAMALEYSKLGSTFATASLGSKFSYDPYLQD